MITKEEFLKAVETVNAYLEQAKEECKTNSVKEYNFYHITHFLKWFDNLNLDKEERAIKKRIINCLSNILEEKYFEHFKNNGYHDIRNYNSVLVKRIRNLGEKSGHYLLNSIKQYETIHPKTIH
jgi:CRISPR/Cas system CSM-associated protein Csm4 (group 5 of RAMP superfamily)